MALSARVGQLPCPARPLFAQKAMREVPVGHRCRPSAGDHPGLSPRPVWLQLPPSAQSMGGETNTERWGLWGPTLGLQPAAPHGTSLRVCVCVCVCVCVTQWCPTLCDPTDCGPPGSSVHGILQERILEWAATSFSRDLPERTLIPAWLSLLSGAFLSALFSSH